MINVLELLDRYGIQYVREGKDVRTGWVGLQCRFCNHSGQYLGVSINKGFGSCWLCGFHSLADILVIYAGIRLGEALEVTKGLVRPVAQSRPTGQYKPPEGVGPFVKAHVAYLKGRGFTYSQIVQIVSLWGVQGIGIAPRLAWSLFIPVTTAGQPVSWTTRSIGTVWRYYGAKPEEEAAPAKSTLLGLDFARHAVIVVEGPFDAFKIGPGAAALMGIGHTAAQVNLIAGFPSRAICFDNEPKAQERARRLADDLSPFPGVTKVVQLDAADPGSASPAEIAALRWAFLD